MSAPDNAEYELLTEHFSYPPVSLLDDIINAVNVLADHALGAVERALRKISAQNLGFGNPKKRGAPGADAAAAALSPDEAAKREIEHGTHQLETLLNASIDKNFDIFELYVMRNILTVKPDDRPYMQLAHYKGLDFSPPGDVAGASPPPSLESITQLRRRLHASQQLQLALETERVRNDALLATLRAAVGVKGPAPTTTTTAAVKTEDDAAAVQEQQQANALGFLHDRGTLEEGGSERPIATTTEFTLAQLQTLRTLSSSLRELLPTIRDDDNEEDQEGEEEKSWRRERAEYIERASRRYLETVAGVELGPGGEVRDGEWQSAGRALARDEVEGLEAVMAVLGAAAAAAQGENEEGGAAEDEDESMAQS
ncbi:Centromere protein Mis12 [Cordyceps fumosorosea ARSEF 2679]|uniref:Centromere protein Mis12 n=1 Tax=Cordyceps fumosorosea (strain ARSEF 2679) TaxID=1081104 RepID=A0A162LF77_CORFA|nr:Centromere protein Mis12 [Cordyceps fumosorosea ARSEF 2679]OAA69794.1 Centromere protein Mis12 [Cordyceps fumosorosea ARSEF 2679]